MNLQSISIIFVIIFIPIILISMYYMQMEINTINLQASYDTKLIDATTDALSAFEINTANEDMSSVSDSLRSIIEASNNIFINTLASNLGMASSSKSKILPYIPAVTYVLYDGYYIYAPTIQAKVVTNSDGVYVKVGDDWVTQDGNDYEFNQNAELDAKAKSTSCPSNQKITESDDFGKILYYKNGTFEGKNVKCTTNPDEAYVTTSYILKSFSPYSMQYTGNKDGKPYDVTINYTLDNYINVYGTIDKVYYSKSGYLIDYKKLTTITAPGETFTNNDEGTALEKFMKKYSQNEIDNLVEKNDKKNDISIVFDGITINNSEASSESIKYTGDKISDKSSAIEYYLKAAIFSKWVDDNLSNIITTDESSGNNHLTKINQDGFSVRQNGEILKGKKTKDEENQLKLFWEYNEGYFFKTDGKTTETWNVDETNSRFYEHKRKVIQNSIQYNLNLAMATYNAGQGDEYYQMPILSEPEWDKLLSNVSILTFMQGIPCGLKTYNNYSLVTSSNNELMTNIDDIYYIPIKQGLDIGLRSSEENSKTGELDTCHDISCQKLVKKIEDSGVDYFQSFSSKDLKYDKSWNSNTRKYEYDHVCNKCYYCLVNSNNTEDNEYGKYKLWTKLDKITNKTKAEQKQFDELNSEESNRKLGDENSLKFKLYQAELIAIGKIRNNTYKQNSIIVNNGFKVEDFTNKTCDISRC